MLNFSPSPRPNKKRSTGRRLSIQTEMTAVEIKQEANRLLTIGLSEHAWNAIDRLSVGGVMSTNQLGVNARTLRKYAHSRLLTRLPFSPDELAPEFEHYGLPYEISIVQLYVLGPVGLEIASKRHKHQPLTGYLSYTLGRTMHDVILNEIVLRLVKFATEHGWFTTWFGTNSAVLYNFERTREILEPDALLVFRKEQNQVEIKTGKKTTKTILLEQRVCIEYHNENKQSRAEEKIRKYQAAYETGEWRKRWDTDTFPLVLAVFQKNIVGIGYQNTLKGRKPKVTFCGKYLAGVLENNLALWSDLATGEKIYLLPDLPGENVP